MAGRRYLPREGLVRTVLAEVPASSEDYPAEPRNVWRLKPSLEESVDFALEGELQPQPDVVFTGFGSRSQVRMLPYGPPLSAIASDHFAFLTAAEGPAEAEGSVLQAESEDQVWEQRLRALELGMRQLQTSIRLQLRLPVGSGRFLVLPPRSHEPLR